MNNLIHEICKAGALLRSLPKSLWFNFYYLPFFHAIRLPIFVSHRVKLRNVSGSIHLDSIRTGIVQIGFGSLGQNSGNMDAAWSVKSGSVHFQGKTRIGCGANIFVDGGKILLGENFDASRSLIMMCNNHLHIGKNVLLSWNVTLMDHDGHTILQNQQPINPTAPITIGDHVWIGCDSTILKGSNIASNCVVGTKSLVSGKTEPNTLIAGTPAKTIKENISWQQ